MLIWMRNSTYAGFFKLFLMGLLLLAVTGLVMMDVGGFFRNTMSSGTIAKGGGVNIGITEFDRTLRRVLASRGIGPQEAYQLGLVDDVLASEIQGQLFTKEAHDTGLMINDEMVMRQVAKLAEPLATEGRSKKEALQQILRQQSISEGEFVESIRSEMGNTLLRAAIQPPSSLTSPLMVQALYLYDNEKRSADVVFLKNSDVKDIAKPTDEQIQKFYEANKIDFLIPESRTITIATFKKSMVESKTVVSDEQLQAEYDKNVASFTKPSHRMVEQAVFPTKEEAEKALTDLRDGKPVANMDTQDLEQNGLLPEIATPVFAAKKGDVVGPVQTTLGWHIMRVKDILPESVTPFAEVKDKLRQELSQISQSEAFYNLGTEIEDRAASGDKLEDIVNEYSMTTEIVGPLRRNGANSDGKDLLSTYGADKAKVIEAAFDFDAGEIAPVIETADQKLLLVRVDQTIPDTYKPLASVKGDLEKRWMNEQARLTNEATAKEIAEAVKAKTSLADIAKTKGATVQKIDGIARFANPPAPLTPVVSAQIFAANIGDGVSAAVDNGYIVAVPTAAYMPSDTSKAPEKDMDSLKELTGTSLSQDILTQYIAGLSANKKIKINQPALEQVYGTTKEQP